MTSVDEFSRSTTGIRRADRRAKQAAFGLMCGVLCCIGLYYFKPEDLARTKIAPIGSATDSGTGCCAAPRRAATPPRRSPARPCTAPRTYTVPDDLQRTNPGARCCFIRPTARAAAVLPLLRTCVSHATYAQHAPNVMQLARATQVSGRTAPLSRSKARTAAGRRWLRRRCMTTAGDSSLKCARQHVFTCLYMC